MNAKSKQIKNVQELESINSQELLDFDLLECYMEVNEFIRVLDIEGTLNTDINKEFLIS